MSGEAHGLRRSRGAGPPRSRRVPGVAAAGAGALHAGDAHHARSCDAPGFAEIQGIDPAAHGRVILDEGEADPFAAAVPAARESGRDGIMLGEELARQVGVFPGDLVRVLVPRADADAVGARAAQPRLRGRRTPTSRSTSSRTPSGPTSSSTRRGGCCARPGQASWVEVRLDDLRQLEPMKRALRRRARAALARHRPDRAEPGPDQGAEHREADRCSWPSA